MIDTVLPIPVKFCHKYEGLHIDDLDGAVTLFKSTAEGTETIAVFDEEHREVIQDLLAEVKRSDELFKDCLAKLEFYVRRFGIEALVEMIEGEEE